MNINNETITLTEDELNKIYNESEDDQLRDRTVIVHCPTGTIVEALLAENALSINNDMQTSALF